MLSIRRELLDKKLENSIHLIRGRVLDIGGKKINKRGSFLPPENVNVSWTYLNLVATDKPDVIGNSESLPFESNAFDTIIMTEVLEYISKPDQVIKEIERVLKKDGCVLISVPFLNPFHGDFKYDLKRYTESGLRNLIDMTNLKIQSLDKMGQIGAVIFDLIRTNLVNSNRSFYQRFFYFLLRLFKPVFYLFDSLQNKKNSSITSGYFIVLRK